MSVRIVIPGNDMAFVESEDPDLLPMLKALGMPDNCTRFRLTFQVNAAVEAEATFYPDIGSGSYVQVVKKYKLVQE
jgi:hypothetical protein